MYVVGLILFFIHIVAFIAGGANSVLMPILGPKIATATPEVRASLFDLIDKVAKVGKYAMATLLITGVLVLWLKNDFVIPNAWFWVKMVLGMVCILGGGSWFVGGLSFGLFIKYPIVLLIGGIGLIIDGLRRKER